MTVNNIKENYLKLRKSVPSSVEIVVAAKTRSPQELKEVINAGAKIIGENYIQETEEAHLKLGDFGKKVNWHMIGHLQTNKVKRAVEIFDMIETLDSLKLAKEIDKRCKDIDKIMPVLIEINVAKEEEKTGVFIEDCLNLIRNICELSNIKVKGLMTMGPILGDPDRWRLYFKKTKQIMDEIR